MYKKDDPKFIQNEFGYCYYVFGTDYNTPKDNGEIHAVIYNLYIFPEFRRQGHGKKILQSVIDAIRATKYEGEIRIFPSPREDSIGFKDLVKFYQSMGLKTIINGTNNDTKRSKNNWCSNKEKEHWWSNFTTRTK